MSKPIVTSAEIPNLTQLYIDHALDTEAVPRVDANAEFNAIVGLVECDITKVQLDAIVNAANEGLKAGGNVCGAIFEAAGPGLSDECAKLAPCETGSARITEAYRLPCNRIIHAVGPVWNTGASDEVKAEKARQLASAYTTSLDLAVQNQCTSIAFPCISTGIYGYDLRKATEVAVAAVHQWLETADGAKAVHRIIFDCFNEQQIKVYKKVLPQYFPPVSSEPSVSDDSS